MYEREIYKGILKCFHKSILSFRNQSRIQQSTKAKGVRKYANLFLTKFFPEEVVICTALVIATFLFQWQIFLLRLVSMYLHQGQALETRLRYGHAVREGRAPRGWLRAQPGVDVTAWLGRGKPVCQMEQSERSQKTFHRAFNSPIDFHPIRKPLC